MNKSLIALIPGPVLVYIAALAAGSAVKSPTGTVPVIGTKKGSSVVCRP